MMEKICTRKANPPQGDIRSVARRNGPSRVARAHLVTRLPNSLSFQTIQMDKVRNHCGLIVVVICIRLGQFPLVVDTSKR